jgi:cation diffusion facilitator family transporter
MNETSELIPGKPRERTMRRVTLTAAFTNLSLSLAQIVGGLFTQSQALIADGMHTLSDLMSDGVVLLAGRQANVEPDSEHPYGHARIETLATVVVGLLLVGVGIGIALDAGQRLFEPERLLSPEPLALAFAVLAIVLKEALYRTPCGWPGASAPTCSRPTPGITAPTWCPPSWCWWVWAGP